ncbi:hypothetical protein [Pseudoalteromonas pernae]|uniref:hypothetical protein n=1 Tax=Pseudoalteromonas pernae TaxID=3118054 RepID=UPI003242C06B
MANTNTGSLDNPVYIKNKHQNSLKQREYDLSGKRYLHRPLLQKHTKNNSGEHKSFSFDKAPDGYEQFTLNVISNPHLQPREVKVALALFEILDWRMTQEGKVFICTTKNLNLDNYGDDGRDIYFNDGLFREIETTPLCEIISKTLKLRLSNDGLNKVLTRLDSFHYINISPVCYSNSKLGRLEQVTDSTRTYLKLIEINDMMDKKTLLRTWC